MITIDLNKELDYQAYNDFRNFSIGGIDFGKMITDEHPKITLENHKDYIDKYYRIHATDIASALVEINKELLIKQVDFDAFVNKYFGPQPSDHKYIGYLSIFNCNPRYLDTKIFQIYFKKDIISKLEVCFHEAIHFYFFDYCDKYLKNETAYLDKNSGKFWELSEIFNAIIMNQRDFRRFFDREERLFYPDFKDKLETAKKIWSDCNGDVGHFISAYLAKNT